MASKRLKKKKQAAAVLQKQQPVQEKEPVTKEMEQNAQETENGGQDICFRMDVDLQQEEKEEMKNMNFYVQWNGKEFCQADIVEQIKKQWESMGHTPESLEKLNIYLKPEESRAYFVAIDSVLGCVELYGLQTQRGGAIRKKAGGAVLCLYRRKLPKEVP